MNILIEESDIDIIETLLSGKEKKQVENRWKLRANRGKYKINIQYWGQPALEKVSEYLYKKALEEKDRSAKRNANLMSQWMEIRKNPKGQVAPKLDALPSVMAKYISTGANRYLFTQDEHGHTVAWFVRFIKYHPAQPGRYYQAAYVNIKLDAVNAVNINNGRSKKETCSSSIQISAGEWHDKTMDVILKNNGYFLETPERMKSYEEELSRFMKYYDQEGFQMNVSGKAFTIEGWGDSKYRNVTKNGLPSQMVVDQDGGEDEEEEWQQVSLASSFWAGQMDEDDEDDECDYDGTEKQWPIPVHPILSMFDLSEHSRYRVHINDVEPYEYDTKVDKKLVLPDETKEFIEVLIDHSRNSFVDIISGKEGGTVILLEGPPGVGKTLSAEVYAEKMERPLYKVQSSQLGTTAEALEEQLKAVLARSERWGAILLIDEADVYVSNRGSDINQNAVVGVFLRVLEYYRGVLFMTTNRGIIIDDAIVSRLTARFTYKNPTKSQQRELWQMLSAQNKIPFTDEQIKTAMNEFPDISGRDIKNLLKLGYVMSLKRKTEVTVEILKFVSQFRQTTESRSK